MSELSFRQIVDVAQTEVSESGVLDKNNFTNAVKDDLSAQSKSRAKWFVDKFIRSTDDRIVVPTDMTTLIGKNFSELYLSSSEKMYDTSVDTQMSVLNPGSEYETEMHGGFLSKSTLSSYQDLDIKTKLVYEIVLLSKKYAYQCDVNNPDANVELENGYRDDLIKYMSVCAQNRLNWDKIVRECSNELQTETRDYLKVTKQVIPDTNVAQIDRDRVIAVRANRLIVSNASEQYIDEIMPALSDDLKMEDMEHYTSEVSSSDNTGFIANGVFIFTTFVKNIAAKVKSWLQREPIHNVANAAKDAVVQDAENLMALQEAESASDTSVSSDTVSQSNISDNDAHLDITSNMTDVWHQVTESGYVNSDVVPEDVKTGKEYLQDGVNYLKNGAQYGWEHTEGVRENLKEFGNDLFDGAKYGVEQTRSYLTQRRESQAQSALGTFGDSDGSSSYDAER